MDEEPETDIASKPGDPVHATDSDVNGNEDSLQCPLFMGTDGLPSNFASNNALAAIASLLNDDDEDGDTSTCHGGDTPSKVIRASIASNVTPKQGGGKVSRRSANKSRAGRNRKPYNKPESNDKPKATMGEAQLFLKMWKI